MPFFGSLQKAWNAAARDRGVQLRWVAVGHAIGAAVFSEADPAFVAESLIESGGEGKPDPWGLMRRWRKERPAAVINLSQSVRLALAARLSGVPIRAGIADNRLGMLYTHRFRYRDQPPHIHVAERYAPLLAALTGQDQLGWLPMDPARFGGRGALDKLRAAGWQGQPYATLAFGTRGFNKRWFPETGKWPELARLLQARGLAVIWLGGPDEAALGGELAALTPGSMNLAGQTSIPEACFIQHGAWGNVAIDTGLAHTAAATGRPLVTIMGAGASLDSLIGPQGPRTLCVRGPVLDVAGDGQRPSAYGNTSHRLEARRVLALLEALVSEDAG